MKKIVFFAILAVIMSANSCTGGNYIDKDVVEFELLLKDNGASLIDVRTPAEYEEGHIAAAVNIDYQSSSFLKDVEFTFPKDQPIAVYCRSGKRSAGAARLLASAGYTVYNLKGGYLAWTEAGRRVTKYEVEVFKTDGGSVVSLCLIKHGSVEIEYDGLSIQVDPVGDYGKKTDYATEFPKADVILVTHEHPDHLEDSTIIVLSKEDSEQNGAAQTGAAQTGTAQTEAAQTGAAQTEAAQTGAAQTGTAQTEAVQTGTAQNSVSQTGAAQNGSTLLILNRTSAERIGRGTVIGNGEKMELPKGIVLEAVPAYNTTPGREKFHPKGNGNGYVLTIDGFRIYIAGDTEDVPEMADLKDIDVALLPVNQPYTMTPEQCANAAKMFTPKVLIPYHFGKTDLSGLQEMIPNQKILFRQMQ